VSLIQVQAACAALLVFGAALIFLLERAFPHRASQSAFRRGFATDFFIYSLAQGYVVGVPIGWLIGLLEQHGLEARPFADVPWYVQVPFFLVFHDFNLYWFHRWQHASPRLWRTHEPHHTNTELDWVAGSRASPIEIVLTELMKYLPMVLLGASAKVVIAKGTIDAIWGMYLHSNIDVRAGRLQYVINGPEMHRWHHALDEEALNKNLATKVAAWDWLFGTAYWPQHRRPSGYGLVGGEPAGGYLGQQLFSLRPFAAPQPIARPQA